jgi:hypothetical protein
MQQIPCANHEMLPYGGSDGARVETVIVNSSLR